MTLKTIAIGMMLMMIGSNFIVSTATYNGNDIDEVDKEIKTINIRVAILWEEPLGHMIGTAKSVFPYILYNTWMVGNRSYQFITTPISDKDILNGELNTDNYDVLIGPGGDVGDGESIAKGFYRLPKVKRWKENIAQFIKDGGGYCGYCGGTALFTGLSKKPTTFIERQYDKSAIGVSCVKSYYKDVAVPIFYPFQRTKPEKVGAALYFYAYPSMETQINTNHPIFDDYLENTRRIKWIGGPALVLPDELDREVHVLTRYPAEKLSENESTRVHVWKYTGGFRGFIRGYFKLRNYYKTWGVPLKYLHSNIHITYYYATDWEKTDKILDLNFSNKPGNTAEIYPNENKGRIVLDGLHPEYPVYFGGHIEEAEDTKDNCLMELYPWVNRTPPEDTPQDEERYNWWIVRRQVAWAAKVPDNDLPPVYGVSQVSDIYPYDQPVSFELIGNVEEYRNILSSDLYYRFSQDNSSWTDWGFFSSDVDMSDGWSWDFDSPKGSGYYQFYSSVQMDFYDYIQIEKAPPGPDAIVHITEH